MREPRRDVKHVAGLESDGGVGAGGGRRKYSQGEVWNAVTEQVKRGAQGGENYIVKRAKPARVRVTVPTKPSIPRTHLRSNSSATPRDCNSTVQLLSPPV